MSRSSQRNQRDTRRRLDPTLPEGAIPSGTDLLDLLEVKAISEALGIRPTEVFGQDFVRNAGTVRKAIATGGVETGNEAVKANPGLGSLTLTLLGVDARVRAVEIDPTLVAALSQTMRTRMSEAVDRLHVIIMDTARINDIDDFGVDQPTLMKLATDLPHSMAAPVLLNIPETFPSVQDVAVMVQAEAADRLVVDPESRTYGVSSMKVS